MATTAITINVDSTILPTAIAALNWCGGYQAQVPDPNNPGQTMANPQTPAQAAKQRLIALVMNDIANYEGMLAQQSVTPPASNLIS